MNGPVGQALRGPRRLRAAATRHGALRWRSGAALAALLPLPAGLGAAEAALVRVHWPDGGLGPWQRLEAGGFYLLERGVLRAARLR